MLYYEARFGGSHFLGAIGIRRMMETVLTLFFARCATPFDRQKGGQMAQKVAGENKKSVFGVVGMKIIMYFCYTTKKD